MQIRLKCFTPIGATVNNKFQGVLGRIYEVCFSSNDSTYMTKVSRCFTPIGATVNNKFQGVLGRIYEVCFSSNDSTYMTNV